MILSFLLPGYISLSTQVPVQLTAVWRTFDGVGLGKLCQILDERFGNILPRLAFSQPQVNMCTRELIHMELETPHRQVRLAMDISKSTVISHTLWPCEYVVPASEDRANANSKLTKHPLPTHAL